MTGAADLPPEVMFQGDPWVCVAELPRLVAESYRRLLSERGVVSVVRTPFQWVFVSPVIEIETGGYLGEVSLYVPRVQYHEAMNVLGGE